MTPRPIPEHAKLQQTFKDWEFGLAAHCKNSETGIEPLPSEVVQAWDDMEVAWNAIKDHAPNPSEADVTRFHAANRRLQQVWEDMISNKHPR
ncbi:MAG: hypothetical protein CMO05_04115 [Thalassospira sp.]|jgi:hypothetical protein|uniref:hypothetical protein n=1 Tax=Thalassospira sp. GB04J01 TaxID=1485225 RepID=UPI000C0E17E3|nr:hypothetical protein [Thalassospira sp. GB04J01]MBV16644.1 hypothetical protein [Thalassospira sp.]|tara:strand:+ start:64422 stop:64697 length:276 start_codon:yes stop_codon:yes gene_type:complete